MWVQLHLCQWNCTFCLSKVCLNELVFKKKKSSKAKTSKNGNSNISKSTLMFGEASL